MLIYLDNAATTRFKPFCVQRAVLQELRNGANPGRSAHRAGLRAAMCVEECRSYVTERFFDGNVIFTKNCTEALNLAILGCTPTDQVITTVYEHNSVLRPLHQLASAGKITLKIISPAREGLEEPLLRALHTRTSLIVMTRMSNVTGEVLPVPKLAALAKSITPSVKILVDMAQAAGHIDTDFRHIDMAAFAGHKGLHGVQGTGFLLIKKHLALHPLLRGGTGTSSLSLEHPTELPESLEAGTLNTPGISALRFGMEWTHRHIAQIQNRTERLERYFLDNLKELPDVRLVGGQNGIYLLNVKELSSSTVADILSADYGICVRSGLHCAPLMHKHLGTVKQGGIRISFGYKTDSDHIERLFTALEKISHR